MACAAEQRQRRANRQGQIADWDGERVGSGAARIAASLAVSEEAEPVGAKGGIATET
jgi:hypothetical protein